MVTAAVLKNNTHLSTTNFRKYVSFIVLQNDKKKLLKLNQLPSKAKLNAANRDLCNLDHLSHCPFLGEVDVSVNIALMDVSELAGVQRLAKLNA